MKKKFNLIGNTFTHLTGGNKGYSVHGKESKYIEWVTSWEPGLPTFFIDNNINQGYDHSDSPQKYAWLLESKWICPAIDQVRSDPNNTWDRYNYVFTHDQELLAKSDKFKFVPAQGSWIINPNIYNKTKLVSMIASNKSWTEGHIFRLEWIKKLRNKVDLYGRDFNYIEYKEQGLCDYMFSVAIENGSYETYFTEKILDCFLTGTIPIYYGAPDIGKYFNLDGILSLDEFNNISEELYYSKLDAVKENFEIALKMEVLEDFIYLNYFNN